MLIISDIYIAYKPAGWCGLCGRAACRGRYAEGLYKGKGAGHPSVQTRTPCSGFAAWGATDVPLHVPLCGGRETHFEGFPLSTDCVSSCALCVYLKCLLRFSLTVVGASLILKHYKMKQRTFPKPSGWKKDPTPSIRVTCLTPHRILEMFLRLKEMNRRNEALDCVPLSTDVERPAPPACPATGATAESHCGCDRPKPRRAWQLCRRGQALWGRSFPS